MAYDPADIGAVLQGVGALAQAAAIAFTAYLASNTFDGWRRQKLSERRFEQAERILTAAYKARRALMYVRSPLIEAHEQNAAETHLKKQDTWADVDAKRTKPLITAQCYYNRLNAVLDERRAVEECLPMARSLFGAQVENALELLNRQFHIVGIAAESKADDDGSNREFTHKLRSDLSNASGTRTPNEMNETIAAQVKTIEDTLMPVLRLEADH